MYKRSSTRYSTGYILQMVLYKAYVGYIGGIKNIR